MSLFLWKKSYEIGLPEIDGQHRQLVGLINELSDAMMVKQGYKKAPEILERLLDYIQIHFSAEENLMYQMNYPELEKHREAHLDLTEKVLELSKSYDKEGALDPCELLEFMCAWLKEHMTVDDKQFGKFANTPKKHKNRHSLHRV